MAFQILWPNNFGLQAVVTTVLGGISLYAASRVIYLSYFHPLSQFPGPRIAAVSNIWYAYHWLSGRYPWAIEDVLLKYGDVVRIAPNDLVFLTPQAVEDIYSPQHKKLEVFVKSDFQNRGKDLGGIIFEQDPIRHRDVARKISHAFSSKSMRAMEPLVHEYVDYFIERMKQIGGRPAGVGLVQWTNWCCMDLSADMSWSEKTHQMRDMKDSVHLDALLAFNFFATVMQVFKRFPILGALQYFFLPLTKLRTYAAMVTAVREGVVQRIKQRGNTEHVDFFDHILPADSPTPEDGRELIRIGSIAQQMMFAEFGPMSDWFYATILFLVENPESYRILAQEIRREIHSYNEIQPANLATLPYLHACLEESLRMFPSNNTGLPRISPGAIVDGNYIPKGTHVQTSVFALSRSSRYFHDPSHYRPERWLPADHPLHDKVFDKDEVDKLHSFSLGPRACLGRETAWTQGKLFLAKVLWTFDIARVEGQVFDLEKTLLHYGFLAKPEIRMRFTPVGERLCNGI
ncbi:hypothetical protein EAF04_006121 [Stromatinia cepivora]|nr:hypothetical protein EAF04_006121 [Stromatinia cepivora]